MTDYITQQTAVIEIGPITSVFDGEPFAPTDLAITVTNPAGTVTHPAINAGDDLGVYYVKIPVLVEGRWVGKWTWGDGDSTGAESFTLTVNDELAFASVSDLAARLGRSLTDAETSQARFLLVLATGLILDALGRDETWATNLTSVPTVFRAVCLEVTARTVLNPSGLRSSQEQLGVHLYSQTFASNTPGLALTDLEQRQLRKAAFGQGTASVRVGSIIDNLADINPQFPLDLNNNEILPIATDD